MMLVAAAQPVTMSGFVAGAITQDNTYSVLGQPFVGTSTGYGYQVTEGIAQSQLVRQNTVASVNVGEEFSANGFHYPATTPAGTYNNSSYVVHGAEYYYDLLKTLKLIVLGPFTCGDLVYDGDLNSYPTVYVAGYCWTQKNLMAEHYADGVTEIPEAKVYNSAGYSDVAANLDTYGRLYTWYSAVGVPENGSTLPTADVHGYVQGICPVGWHIPTATEMSALRAIPSADLCSPSLWVNASSNTNSTGFTALPAGKYSAENLRFEGLGTLADWWGDSGAYDPSNHTIIVPALECTYFCSDPLETYLFATDAVSVRCVKNH